MLRSLVLGGLLLFVTGIPTYASSSAALVVQQLGAVVLFDYTPETDPEQLLGLIGQYAAKADFAEGSVEVFATPADRDLREQSIGGSGDILYKADFPGAAILLRMSASVAEDRANMYGRQLRSVAALFQ